MGTYPPIIRSLTVESHRKSSINREDHPSYASPAPVAGLVELEREDPHLENGIT